MQVVKWNENEKVMEGMEDRRRAMDEGHGGWNGCGILKVMECAEYMDRVTKVC